jgi:hypothetical protein
VTRAGLVLGALVLGSTILRAWASRGVPTPWIAPDEMVYGLLGQGFYLHGHLAILGGPTPFYSLVAPLLAGIPLSFGDLTLGYSVLKVLQALVMSLAAVPVYLWGRTLMSKGWALVAALLTVSLPALAYSGLVLSEDVFYPVFLLAAWAMAAVLRTPDRRTSILFLLAFVFAAATRLQAVVLVPAFLTAIALDAGFLRSTRRLRAFVPAVVGLALIGAAWILWQLVAGHSVLGGYSAVTSASTETGSASLGHALRFVLYHAGDAAFIAGAVPVAALLVLLWGAFRGSETDDRARAYVATACSLFVWLVIEVGVFAAREIGLLAERNLFAIAPLLFLGLCLWIARGGPGGHWVRSIAGLAVAGVLLALPIGRYVTPGGLPDSPSLVLLDHFERRTSEHTLETVFYLAAAAMVVLFALLPRRGLVVLPVLVFAGLAGGSLAAGHEIVNQAKTNQRQVIGPQRRWIDAAATGPVAYVYDGQGAWNAVWQSIFWNRKIHTVYDLPGDRVPGPLPQTPLTVRPDGVLVTPDGKPVSTPFALATYNYGLDGQVVANRDQQNTDRLGVNLWQTTTPLRLTTVVSGLEQYGDLDAVAGATMHVYGCRAGKFSLVLLVKTPQHDRIYLDGKLVRNANFQQTQTWYVDIPVKPTREGSNRICVLTVKPGGPYNSLGSTRFAWQPAT